MHLKFLNKWMFSLLLCATSCACSHYESCQQVILQDRLSVNGTYKLTNTANETFEVYCLFDKPLGYTFISMKTTVHIDIEKLYDIRSFALIRHIDSEEKQYQVKVEQLSRYQDQANLSFFYSENPEYANPQFSDSGNRSYIYLGFLPKILAADNTTQGYRAGGRDYNFTNCDRNPNSYIVFYFNVENNETIPSKESNELMKGWITESEELSTMYYMDIKFYFVFEMHMGGCGGLSTSGGMDYITASLGLPFDNPQSPCKVLKPCLNNGVCRDISDPSDSYSCQCPAGYSGNTCQQHIPPGSCETLKPCQNNGMCRDTKDGYTCSCPVGYSGYMCEYRQCRCPCSSVGENKWSHLLNTNVTKEELQEILKEVTDKIQKELKINLNTTSSFRRRTTSAPDERRSSQSIGVLGIIFLCLPVLLIILADMSRLFR